ncbi:MAG: sporulation protein YqfD [Oscillospiraceae bacterium]|nr:sporulation protein YqfD [Oscillospiraceae bacterium]
MNRIVRWLRGEVRFCLTGAAPQDVLNVLSQAGIPFWDICRKNETCYAVSVLPRDREKVQRHALHVYCQAEVMEERGLLQSWNLARKRPFLLFSLLLALAASFFLQSFVWVIEVEGTEKIHPQEIIRALEEEGIGFGVWAASVDSQALKLKMLSKQPKISWMAVNRKGGKLTVLLSETSGDADVNTLPPAHLVAVRDGVITDFTVLEGMRMCNRGEAVKAGQILVSGLEDYGLFLKAVRAQGEIYARTWYSGSIVTPVNMAQKVYTGREWSQASIQLGRKRINLFGNSGIFTASCDKMVKVKNLTFSGYTFPLTVEFVTYREYELKEVPASESGVQEHLEETWRRELLSSMVAGTIEDTKANFLRSGDLYVLYAESVCNEMIAKQLPIQQIYEGEQNG